MQPLSLCIALIILCCKMLLKFTYLFGGEIGTGAISKASIIPSCNLHSVVCVRLHWGHSVRDHCGFIDKSRRMISVFVDKHSILCNLCIAIVCWRGPVYSDTVACCLSDGHIGWWVGFWVEGIKNMLAAFVMQLVSMSPWPLHRSWYMNDRDVAGNMLTSAARSSGIHRFNVEYTCPK